MQAVSPNQGRTFPVKPIIVNKTFYFHLIMVWAEENVISEQLGRSPATRTAASRRCPHGTPFVYIFSTPLC